MGARKPVDAARQLRSSLIPAWLRRNKVRDLWNSVEMKRVDLRLEYAIGIRHSFVLIQMFQPRFKPEGLEESARLSDVLKDIPRVGPIPATFVSQPADRREKRFAIAFEHEILYRHRNRSTIVFNLVGDHRNGPVH